MECDKMIEDYETFTSDLLKWIETKIAELGTRDFANSLRGVQVSFRFRPFCKKSINFRNGTISATFKFKNLVKSQSGHVEKLFANLLGSFHEDHSAQ